MGTQITEYKLFTKKKITEYKQNGHCIPTNVVLNHTKLINLTKDTKCNP